LLAVWSGSEAKWSGSEGGCDLGRRLTKPGNLALGMIKLEEEVN